MSLSNRSRRKGIDAARRLLPAGTDVRAYGVGRAPARITQTTILGVIAIVVVMVVAYQLGYIVWPGGIVVLILARDLWRPRAFAVADRGVALLDRSPQDGKPRQTLALLPHAALLQARVDGRRVSIPVGDEHVVLSRKEHALLVAAVPGR